jgi:raffinose/stachyose/melibiose transport system permease protein
MTTPIAPAAASAGSLVAKAENGSGSGSVRARTTRRGKPRVDPI